MGLHPREPAKRHALRRRDQRSRASHWQHRHREGSQFAAEYGVSRLVYAEAHDEAMEAITREKQIKKWNRRWKLELIEKANPQWLDLYERIHG